MIGLEAVVEITNQDTKELILTQYRALWRKNWGL